MKNTAILLIVIFINNISFSQDYYGKIIDAQNESIAYANIIIYKLSDKSMLKGGISDENGDFKISIITKDPIYLEISFLGFATQKIELIKGNLGTITLKEDGQNLDVIELTSRKKLIQQKVDRLVFNIENSIVSQGMSGLDVLQKTPLVRVDETQGVSIVGKSNVAVLINGRDTNLSGSELTNYLQSLKSDDIKSVEVITTPPSKYSAQGNSGLINLILKKNPNIGWSGTVKGSYQRNTKNGFNSGITLNYQKEKLNSSLKLRQFNIGFSPKGTRDLISTKNVYTTENRVDKTYGLGLNYSLDYQLNKKSNIGIIYDYGNSNYDMDSENTGKYGTQSVIDSTLNTHAEHRWKSPRHTLNTYYDFKIDSIGKKLSVTGNFLTNNSNKNVDFNTINTANQTENIVKNTSKMDYSIYSGGIDFILPYKWGKIETGLKLTSFDNKSNVKYLDYINNEFVLNANNSNVFDYNEQNYAGYVSVQKDINKKWSTKAGLRYEYTVLEGTSPSLADQKVKNNYGKIFPSVYLSYNPSDNHAFSINYSKRINRPGFQALNPFRWYSNPYMYTQGNPLLDPSLNDNFEFSYSYKNKLIFKFYEEYKSNGYINIARFTNGIYSNIYANSYNQNDLGLSISYYDTLFKIWELSLNTNTYYTRTLPKIPELESVKNYSMYYSINNTIRLNSKKTWFLMLNYWHSLPWILGNTHVDSMHSFSPGMKMSFLDKKLHVNLVASDVFKTIKNNGHTNYTGYKENFTQYNDHRKISISITYSFGKKSIKGKNKNTNFKEKNRID